MDMIGIGNFVLVNSTAFGEIRNENWYNQYVIPKNLQNSDENYPGINR
ncbi:MAG: hypothetical protein HZB41_09120 [Ignavibacteriae bacterium]|nr:hypothetical protein [Ignavibacteriota bacterium]